MSISEPKLSRSGFAVLIGRPNVGKSTLLNHLCGMHLAAVSPRPQTTRHRILGVVPVEDPSAQIVFWDTPGLEAGRGALHKFMREQSLQAAGDADVVVHLIDASERALNSRRQPQDDVLERALRQAKGPRILAVNKVDALPDKSRLLPLLEQWGKNDEYKELVPISAKTGDGVDRLLRVIAGYLPEGPPLYPSDTVTDRSERFIAGELIREQLFRQLGQEVPYGTTVVVESFEEREEKNDVVIDAIIHIDQPSHKPIVLGAGGQRIREIGSRSRQAISEMLGRKAHVKLLVRVSEGWADNPRELMEMGYE